MGLFSSKNGVDELSERVGFKLMVADDQSWFQYQFKKSDKNISDNDKIEIYSLMKHVEAKGKRSAFSNKIIFNNYKGMDVVLFLDDNKNIQEAYPIILRGKGYGGQMLYDLMIVYNRRGQEYDIQFIDKYIPKFETAKSGLSGDKVLLEIFLNYGIGVVRNEELFMQLKESKEVIINGFLLKRIDNKVIISVESEYLLRVFGKLKCEISNEAFLLLIDYWYDTPRDN